MKHSLFIVATKKMEYSKTIQYNRADATSNRFFRIYVSIKIS